MFNILNKKTIIIIFNQLVVPCPTRWWQIVKLTLVVFNTKTNK